MKSSIKNILLIEFVMFILLFINFFITNVFNNYIYSIFLGLILILLISIYGIELKPSVKQKRVLQSILITVMIYFLITYLSGLFVGFNKTIYSFNLTNFINNIIPTILIIVLSELVRYEMIRKSNYNIWVVITSCILFIVFELSINFKLYDFSIPDEAYQYIGIVLFASISKNIFMTIQMVYTDYINNIIYRIIMENYIYIIPIVPALGPYVNSVLLIALPIILCFVTYGSIKLMKNERPRNRKKSNILYIIIFIIMLIILMLNSGFFKYQTLTVGSNSMKNFMSKGDVIIIRKATEEEKLKIKKGQILIFKYDKKIISHRVYEVIKRKDTVYFRTKGDNNDQVDSAIIKTSDVIGTLSYRIKYIGLPSIWLQELFK